MAWCLLFVGVSFVGFVVVSFVGFVGVSSARDRRDPAEP
jgi:hypothetical protein